MLADRRSKSLEQKFFSFTPQADMVGTVCAARTFRPEQGYDEEDRGGRSSICNSAIPGSCECHAIATQARETRGSLDNPRAL